MGSDGFDKDFSHLPGANALIQAIQAGHIPPEFQGQSFFTGIEGDLTEQAVLDRIAQIRLDGMNSDRSLGGDENPTDEADGEGRDKKK